ncbi:uncharacterized protein LAJ45_07482 [Morchella importuna]|uniref:uncharacterized protein n=1 Tax=Morchella importuna TaxID=1174673 RepID=UPI001E8E6083|nr:uncharacterized protein LAJ45_07482 [Morchella importuna]KAH8148381.1 hypothetical protein LAJ45_07482 [Morchella importuna]
MASPIFSDHEEPCFTDPLEYVDEDYSDVLTHLAALRDEASKDGDVVFALPNNVKVWAHSPLFYIAAGERPPEEFGDPRRLDLGTDIMETAKNNLGVELTVLHIPEENRPSFEEAMGHTYTRKSLRGLWEAMGYDSVDPTGKGPDAGVPLDSTLPASMLPDFEIHLKAPGNRPSFCAVKVHKFLLARRIPYYETFFNSKFGDASGNTSTIYTEDFTPFSLWIAAGYVYRQELKELLNPCPGFRNYITLHLNNPHKAQSCNSCVTDRTLPDIEIADKFVDITRAARYLQCVTLENSALYLLSELGHRFECTGRGCSIFVPHILDVVAKSDISGQRILDNGISLLALLSNITPLWKRPLLNCSPSVLELLIAKVASNSQKEGEERRAIRLFETISDLRRHTLASKNAKDWDTKLLVPLMEHTVEFIAKAFDSLEVTTGLIRVFHPYNLSKPVGGELLSMVMSNKTLREETCRQIFIGIMELAQKRGTVPEVEQAKRDCIAWFKRKWVTLTFSPAIRTPVKPTKAKSSPQEYAIFKDREPDDQEDSTEPPRTPTSTHWRGPPLASPESGTKKKLSIDTSDDGNFFSAWSEEDLAKLTSVIPASIADLVAKSPQSPAVDDRYKPVRTPRGNSSPRRGGVSRGRGGHSRGSASVSRIILNRIDARPNREQH